MNIDEMAENYIASNYVFKSVCRYYRHDFDLLCPEEQEEYVLRAKSWFDAWKKALEDIHNRRGENMNHLESQIQAQICQFLQLHKIYFFSVPNERKASPQAMGRLISAGLRKGVSDLVIFLGSETIYMEVKTPTGRQSDAQKRFQKQCEDSGRTYVVVRSVEDVKSFLHL